MPVLQTACGFDLWKETVWDKCDRSRRRRNVTAKSYRHPQKVPTLFSQPSQLHRKRDGKWIFISVNTSDWNESKRFLPQNEWHILNPCPELVSRSLLQSLPALTDPVQRISQGSKVHGERNKRELSRGRQREKESGRLNPSQSMPPNRSFYSKFSRNSAMEVLGERKRE